MKLKNTLRNGIVSLVISLSSLSCYFNNLDLNQINIEKIKSEKVTYPYSVAFISDLHVRGKDIIGRGLFPSKLKKTLENIKEYNPKFIGVIGDFTRDGQIGAYIHYLNQTENYPIPIITIAGNHDLIRNGMDYYQDFFGDFDNYFTYGNEVFVYMNNIGKKKNVFYQKQKGLDEEQLNKLEKWLEEDSLNKIVLMHAFIDTNPESGDGEFKNVRPLIKILEENKATFISGHRHEYKNYTTLNNRYIAVGEGGNNKFIWKNYKQGFVIITFNGDKGYTGKVMKVSGKEDLEERFFE